MIISEEKQRKLQETMLRLGVREEDLEEKFIRGSGSGGQKINKTSSCVQLIHRPSGIEIKCQKDRSRAANRFFARRDLCEKLEEQVLGDRSKRRQAVEKIRRQKRRRSRRAKAKMMDAKAKQGAKKKLRGPVRDD